MLKIKKFISIIFFTLTLFSCQSIISIPEITSHRNEKFILWAHSDIQPENLKEKKHYEQAVEDIKTLSFTPDMALLAGDLVWRRDSRMYWSWQKKLRAETKIPYWFELAGNHDHNDSESYLDNSGKPYHYAVRYGNLLLIFLSDETKSAITNISDEAFEWWKNLVVHNRDLIIVTITHASLKQSGLISTVNWTMIIEDSDRFWNVIQEYPIDLWISGHTHLPNSIPIKSSTPSNCKTLFLDISSIHKSFGSPVESWILIFKNRSRDLYATSRAHEKGEFYSSSFFYQLSHPFINSSEEPVVVSSIICKEEKRVRKKMLTPKTP